MKREKRPIYKIRIREKTRKVVLKDGNIEVLYDDYRRQHSLFGIVYKDRDVKVRGEIEDNNGTTTPGFKPKPK